MAISNLRTVKTVAGWQLWNGNTLVGSYKTRKELEAAKYARMVGSRYEGKEGDSVS